jgi:hypothetical protein
MLANANRLLCTAGIYFALNLMLGCQATPQDSDAVSPPPLNTATKISKLSEAQRQLSAMQFAIAEADFQSILNTSTDQITLQQALAGLTLVYLHPNSPAFNLSLATSTLDRLYQQMMRWPQNEPSLNTLLFSLKLCLEQRLKINEEIHLREIAQAKQQQLMSETFTLQRALEKLRQLTLQ